MAETRRAMYRVLVAKQFQNDLDRGKPRTKKVPWKKIAWRSWLKSQKKFRQQSCNQKTSTGELSLKKTLSKKKQKKILNLRCLTMKISLSHSGERYFLAVPLTRNAHCHNPKLHNITWITCRSCTHYFTALHFANVKSRLSTTQNSINVKCK